MLRTNRAISPPYVSQLPSIEPHLAPSRMDTAFVARERKRVKEEGRGLAPGAARGGKVDCAKGVVFLFDIHFPFYVANFMFLN